MMDGMAWIDGDRGLKVSPLSESERTGRTSGNSPPPNLWGAPLLSTLLHLHIPRIYTSHHPPLMPTASFTPTSHPSIWESIATYTALSTTLALRATCSELRDIVDTVLLHHLIARGGYRRYDGPESLRHRVWQRQVHTDAQGNIMGEFEPAPTIRVRGPFERGYFLSPRPDGRALKVRVPPATSTKGAVMRRRCTVLDIDDHLSPADCRWIARLVSPHTVRLPGAPRATEVRVHSLFNPFEIIHPRVAVLSFPSDHLHLRRPGHHLRMPDKTRRVVLHQVASDDRKGYVLVSGRVRELVLVFRPDPDQGGGDNNSMDDVRWYLAKVVPEVPKASVVVVGLEAVFKHSKDVRNSVLRDVEDKDKVELRTLEEQHAEVGAAKWAVEMEL